MPQDKIQDDSTKGFEGLADKAAASLEAEAAKEGDEVIEDGSEEDVEEESGEEGAKPSGDLVELEDLDEFTFRGKKYTVDQLNNESMMQSDYTKKTQSVAQEKKFLKNLDLDLAAVKGNPALAEQFKNIYPEDFHRFLDVVLAPTPQPGTKLTDADKKLALSNDVTKRLDSFEARMQRRENAAQEKEVNAVVKHLDVVFNGLQDKYPYAVEDAVITRGMQLIEKQEGNSDFKMTDHVWERLYRQDSARNQKAFEAVAKKREESQREANKKGSDTGAGGSAPGAAPVRRTFDQATADAIRDLKANQTGV